MCSSNHFRLAAIKQHSHRSFRYIHVFPNQSTMRYVLTLICFFTATMLFAQKTNCDSISWSKERKLSWDDFKADADTTTDYVTQSSIRLYYKWKLLADTLTISVANYFRPCFAWSKVKGADSLLVHEQGHFTISEYFRRLFIKRLSEQNFKRKNLQSEIQKIYRAISDEQKLLVDQYEARTDFGRIKSRQSEWNEKIANMLDSLIEFDKVEITKQIPVQ